MKVDMDYHFETVLQMEENAELKEFRDWKGRENLDLKSWAIAQLLRKAIERQAAALTWDMRFPRMHINN